MKVKSMMLKRHFMHLGVIFYKIQKIITLKYTKNSTFYYFELFNFCKVRFYRNHKIITLYKMHEK